jgi:hypothetical protein
MCDYSLYTLPNRLAAEAEELVLHKFETGTLGFASAVDLSRSEVQKSETDSFWTAIKNRLSCRRRSRCPAICIPPGARLLLTDIPRPVQMRLRIGPCEVATLTELSDQSYSYRDALLLPNNTRVLLQDLPPGIHAVVLSLSPEAEAEPAKIRLHAA